MELKKVLENQKAFYETGYSKSVTYRELMLERLLKAVKNNEEDLLKALKADLGNSFMEGYTTELGVLYSSINMAIKNIHKWAKPQKKKTAFYLVFSKSSVQSVPYGNVLIMSAFNYPILLSLDPLVGAIMAGNTAMLALPASTPSVNKVLVEMLNKTFEASYIYAFVTNRNINSEILTYRYDYIFYTGSPKVGKIVAKAAADNLIPTTLELGGKSPALVSENANVKNAAASIIWGKLLNSGQTCVAPDYVLVSNLVVDDLVLEINKSIEKMYGKNPQNSADYSKIVSLKEMDRLIEIINADKDFIINEYSYNRDNRYIAPVLIKAKLSDVNNIVSMQSELFGPILPIIVYDDLDDATKYINESEIPLAFYPFSTNKAEVNYLLDEVRYGGATANDTVLHVSSLSLPFGGMGNSGYGSYHGKYSFLTFSHQQSRLKTSSRYKMTLMHPPFKGFKEKLVRIFLK